ncbi:MAG: helix-turn-helix domain-containing protein, partial [Chloroflexi bacterium]|nr:helix-turn-helix domain-containing protein [Chloroflexota bacterium]
MIELGQLLQQTRTAQGFTLSDVEAQTRIRQEYLEALEQGQWDRLPNPAVAKGFLRSYARFLKIESHPQVQAVFSPATIAAVKPTADTATAPGSYLPVEIALGKPAKIASSTLRTGLRLALALIPIAALAFVLVRYGLPALLNVPQATPETAAASTALPPAGTPPGTPLILVGVTGTPQADEVATVLPSTYTPTPR